MKVFEVVTERLLEPETVTIIRYVTSEEDSIKSVTDYFTEQCLHSGEDLKSVREILTITNRIRGVHRESK